MSVARPASLHDQMASMSLAPRRRRRILPGVPSSAATSMQAEISQVTDSLQLISVVRAERSLAQAFDEAMIVHMLSFSGIRDLGAAACACRRLSYVAVSSELHWRHAAQRLGINVARLQRRLHFSSVATQHHDELHSTHRCVCIQWVTLWWNLRGEVIRS